MELVVGQLYTANGSTTNRSALSTGIDYIVVSQNIEANTSLIRIFPWIQTTVNAENLATYNLSQRTSKGMAGEQQKTSGTKFDCRGAKLNTKLYLKSSYPYLASDTSGLTLVDEKYCYEFTVPHNSDGALTELRLYCVNPTQNNNNANHSLDSTIDIKVDLPAIPRESDFSNITINYIDDTMFFNINKKNSNFNSSIRLLFTGNTSNPSDRFPIDVCSKDNRTYIEFKADTTSAQYKGVLQYNSNKIEIPLEVELTTYNGNNQVGSSVIVNATAKIKKQPPIVNAAIIDENSSTVKFTGDNTKIIKHLSRPKVTVNAAPQQEAGIKWHSISADGRTYYEQEHHFENGVSNSIIVVNAMDTRNWDNQTPYDLTTNDKWIDYEKITMSCKYCERIEQTSSTIKCRLEGTFFNNDINGAINLLTVAYRYRKQGDDWQDKWIDIDDVTINGNNFIVDTNSLRTDCGDQASWEFQFKANDILMTTSIITKQITLGLGILEIAKEFINVNGDLYIRDYPIKSINDMGNIIVNSVTSKNLFNINGEFLKSGNPSYNISENKLIVIGGNFDSIYEDIPITENTKYTISFKNRTGKVSIYLNNIWYCDILTGLETAFSSGTNTKLRLYFFGTSDGSGIYEDIMLEKGDKKTEYTPYKKYGYRTNIITVSNDSNGNSYTSTNPYETQAIPFDMIVSRLGSQLTITNTTNIHVGTSISKVLINGNILVVGDYTGSIGIQLATNRKAVIYSSFVYKTGYFSSIVISNALLDVSEGEEIFALFYIEQAGQTHYINYENGKRSWLTVEAVE